MQCLLSSRHFSASMLQLCVCIYMTVLHSSPQKRPSMTHYVNVALLCLMHSPPHLCPYGTDTLWVCTFGLLPIFKEAAKPINFAGTGRSIFKETAKRINFAPSGRSTWIVDHNLGCRNTGDKYKIVGHF